MATQLAKDPVCGMMIDPTSAAGKSEYKGGAYYFCAAGCQQEFDADPEKFLSSSSQPAGLPKQRPSRRLWEFWRG
jgi:P-type Cu+ transporter